MFFLTLWRGRDIIEPSKGGRMMEEIRCPNCGNVLDQMESYDMLYPDNGITECCIFGCYNCGKEYQIDLHYKYVNYSIEGEN